MNDIDNNSKLVVTRFELTSDKGQAAGNQQHFALTKKRMLIGRADICDIIIPDTDVSAIHAILELMPTGAKIYDLHSLNGTFVNREKVVVGELKEGDQLMISKHQLTFGLLQTAVTFPPPLDIQEGHLPPAMESRSDQTGLPIPPVTSDGVDVPLPKPATANRIVRYPLARDPKAEFSEYIFEDDSNLYPIFNYDLTLKAVEVIILFKDNIYSVDYIPIVDGGVPLVGIKQGTADLEYAYLPKGGKERFIEIKSDEVFIYPPAGHEHFSLKDDQGVKQSSEYSTLDEDDILQFFNGDVQISVRRTDHPPAVDHAPIMRRDSDFKKYLIAVFLTITFFMGAMTIFEVDPELDEEKNPARVATILYKKKWSKKSTSIKKAMKDNKRKIIKPKVKSKVEKIAKKRPSSRKKVTKKFKVRKAAPRKAKKVIRSQRVTKAPISVKKRAASRTTPVGKHINRRSNKRGRVDTYKSPDFMSTMSSLLAKGRSTKNIKVAKNDTRGIGAAKLEGGDISATVTKATIRQRAGSLTGAVSGKLDRAQGVEGLVDKKDIFTAGLPFETVILGGMDPSIIRDILLNHLPQFRYCYQKVLDYSERIFHGVVRMNFIIAASGHVSRAGVESAEASMPGEVKRCVVTVLRGIRFPEPRGGGQVEVNQPFNFYPKRR
ncbi:MAG: AgmX/PglI C-terminal domain-containing protein [Bdellovibrionales bacterium]|nr:AgmX/PglI C-terminal domain-containing protein [Bdellovibrionales bacterium]MBT3527123.1 AgmX/PglI C-terminal domain-containing protein [Bdellovibrionales bacterium]MBT7766156.1 AgmX/PglI C-terminal domain-containing protein [Bdellovibrionales bacterium]